MPDAKICLSTIGYEGASLEDFIATLQAANVYRLLDVRELPISRRKGFAKTALAKALNAVGIEYVHLKGLGDPKSGRDAAKRKDFSSFRRIFKSHMQTKGAKNDLKTAVEYILAGGTCLMCFERDHHTCHRSIVADAVCDILPISIRHLGVKFGLATDHERRLPPGARKSSGSRQGATARR